MRRASSNCPWSAAHAIFALPQNFDMVKQFDLKSSEAYFVYANVILIFIIIKNILE